MSSSFGDTAQMMVDETEISGKYDAPTHKGGPTAALVPIGYLYFFFFAAVFFATVFFAVPHGAFDLQAIRALLFLKDILTLSQESFAVNRRTHVRCPCLKNPGRYA